jgi:hypothetical protein
MLNTEKAITVSIYNRQERDPVKPQVRFDNTNIAPKSKTYTLVSLGNSKI